MIAFRIRAVLSTRTQSHRELAKNKHFLRYNGSRINRFVNYYVQEIITSATNSNFYVFSKVGGDFSFQLKEGPVSWRSSGSSTFIQSNRCPNAIFATGLQFIKGEKS